MEKIAQEVAEQELSRLEEFREFEPRDLEGYEPIREMLIKRIMYGDLQIDEQYNPIVTFRFTNKLREAEGKTALEPQIIKFYSQSNARKLYKQNGAADPATMAACMKDFLPNMVKQVDNKDLNLIEVIILFLAES